MNGPGNRKILLATGNAGKGRELGDLLARADWQAILPESLGLALEVKETGTTFAENSSLKALAYSAHTKLPVLADDSGLMVDALGGAPGVHSARCGGNTDQDRWRSLLERLAGVADGDRGAHFKCVATIAREGRVIRSASGTLHGRIARRPAGDDGFGYDPIFVPDGFDRALAQLGTQTKNQISHRARAVTDLLANLAAIL